MQRSLQWFTGRCRIVPLEHPEGNQCLYSRVNEILPSWCGNNRNVSELYEACGKAVYEKQRRNRQRDREWRVEGISCNVDFSEPRFASHQRPDLLWLRWSRLPWKLAKQVWHSIALLPLPLSEWWKWMWPQDQHASILAKNQYFFPLSCIGPVNCNISIHMCAHSTLILPVCVSCVLCVHVCVCVWTRRKEKRCIEQKLPSVFELLHKNNLCFWYRQGEKEQADWTQTCCQSKMEGFLLFCFAFL